MFLSRQGDNSIAFTKISFVIFILLVCFYVVIRFWHLTIYGLWQDEIFSIYFARLSWGELISSVAQDIVHPPLFYLLLKIWISNGGESLFWLRLFPALTATIAILPFLLLCRELKMVLAEINTALMLLGVNSYLIFYSQELRMYSLLLFFTLFSLWGFVRFIDNKDDPKIFLPVLFIVNLLLIYTHYFGWLVVTTECVCIILWRRKQALSFTAHVALLAFCFAPWAYMVFRVAEKQGLKGNLGWLERPNVSSLIWFYAILHGSFDVPRTTFLGFLIFGFPLLLLAWQVLKRKNGLHIRSALMLALFSFLPVILAFLASQILPQSIWGERYLIIAAAPYLTLVAVALNRLPYQRGRAIFILLVTTWVTASCVYALGRDNKKVDWEMLTRKMMQAEPAQAKNVKVYVFEGWVAYPVRYYLESSGDQSFEVDLIKEARDVTGTHFWVAFRNTTWRAENLPQDIIRSAGCQVKQEIRGRDWNHEVTIFSAECQR